MMSSDDRIRSAPMFEEGRLYAPVTTADDGSVTVHLDDDHPGVADPTYRRRRNEIASAALRWEAAPAGAPVPRIDYTDDEQGVGAPCSPSCRSSTRGSPARTTAQAMDALALPTDRIPQLDEVSAGCNR